MNSNNTAVETLKELILGIIFWGILCQLAGVWFVADKAGCSIGLWIGILMAAGAAVHMYFSLEKALDLDEKNAQKVMMMHNILRYVGICIILGVLMVTELANPLTAFLGIMGLKLGAYMQPSIHKIKEKIISKK